METETSISWNVITEEKLDDMVSFLEKNSTKILEHV